MQDLKYTELLHLNKKAQGLISTKPYEIGILSNVTINSFKEVLEYKCRLNSIEPNIEIGNFDNVVQDSATFSSKNLVIIFYDTLNIIDNVSGFFEDINEETFNQLKQKLFSEIDIIFSNLKKCASIIFNLFSSAYYSSQIGTVSKVEELVSELNLYLSNNKPQNVSLNNIDEIYVNEGIKNSIDYRFYNSSKAPYTFNFFKNYSLSIDHILLKNTGKLKKAIIFDCDNTLWKGIIGEDGVEGIDMSTSSNYGKFFNLVQHIAVYLSKKGVIIGLCSKNNESDVIEVLKNHNDIILKEENIVIKKVNWTDKATNLKHIAQELNIGADSLVFVDDSSFEINLIKQQLPEVISIQVPEKISDYPTLLLKNIYAYFNLTPTLDDVKKTEMYKQQFERENSKDNFASINDYLSSLKIELKIIKDDADYVTRLSQLTQKTNQFNLTTYRYSETEIEQFIKSNNAHVYAMFVKDKFGDSGLTGVCIAKEDINNPTHIIVDSLLMSCRIIGRKIEYVYMNTIITDLEKRGYKTLSANYIPTKKNAQVQSFYDSIGLNLQPSNNEEKHYTMQLSNFIANNAEYIKVTSNNSEIK
jgi:FkbH-like protein